MTQARLPLFGTGIPQIVPEQSAFPVPADDGLTLLDLRGDPTNQIGRLVSLWFNASSLNPVDFLLNRAVLVFAQKGSDLPVNVATYVTSEAYAPVKVLEDYLLRGDVRLFAIAPETDLATGNVGVAWGYYTLEGAAPRTAFELRPLQPDPNIIPPTMGQPTGFLIPPALVPPDPVPTPTDFIIHTVSENNIDEIRVEAFVTILSDPNIVRALLYFEGTPLVAPLVLGPGFISLTSPLTPVPTTESVSVVRRYLDGIPFIGAGALRVFVEPTPFIVGPPDVYVASVFSIVGSFTRT